MRVLWHLVFAGACFSYTCAACDIPASTMKTIHSFIDADLADITLECEVMYCLDTSIPRRHDLGGNLRKSLQVSQKPIKES